MDRRAFFTDGRGGCCGRHCGFSSHSFRTGGQRVDRAGDGVPAILRDFSADDHRRRLLNIRLCTQQIRTCLRKHLITDYLPGQCVYNLGEYPSREPWEPGEYDEQELDRLKDEGIQLIHVMDEWNDRYGLFGGNKLTAVNPAGFRRFVSMVHERGIKILAYASSGYFAGHDPDYRPEWSRPGTRSAAGGTSRGARRQVPAGERTSCRAC